MKIITLMENSACRDDLAAAHGLSLYIETAKHKILFDMGPGDELFCNAEKLGVDLTAVDIAMLSHGHYDHSGGLKRFCEINDHAAIYLHREAFGEYYALSPEEDPRYIGIDQSLERERFIFTGDDCVIDDELTLFSVVPDHFGALSASGKLFVRTEAGFMPDLFSHEQDLLITEGDKRVLIAGCAHRGIVNVLQTGTQRLGRRPDATFGGFHLFLLTEGDPAAERLIEMTGKALLAGETVYYTGHCTGDYAYEKLKTILNDRLQRMCGGITVEI